jgi:phosphohistidine phosphatase
LRHGIAVEPDEWKARDFDRPLTPEGRQRMEREAKAIADLTLGIDVIVTSPLVRARQTAEIVAEALGLRGALVEDERLGGGFGVELLAAIVASQNDSGALLLVGHEPSFSVTVGQLVGKAWVEIKKGALAGVELAGASATRGVLICLIPPKVLTALGKASGKKRASR